MDRFESDCVRYVGGEARRGSELQAGAIQALVDLSFRAPVHWMNLAESLGYSEAHSRRLAHHSVGESIGSFVRRLKLERAAGRLSLREGSISDIASEAGYHTSEAFHKAFLSHFDCSPSEYRKNNRGSDCLHPGYLLSSGLRDGLPSSVSVAHGEEGSVRFLYDGPIFLARVLPDGRIDWLPR